MAKIHESGRYSAALKEKASLEVLKGEKTIQQIASENSISPELVRQWKKQAPEGVRSYLLKSLQTIEVDKVWSSDITYLQIGAKNYYLSVVLDWASRAGSDFRNYHLTKGGCCTYTIFV